MKQALIVIDAQQALIDGTPSEPEVVNKHQLIQTINDIISKAKADSVPIVFIRDLDVAEGQGAGFQIHPDIDSSNPAAIFDKKATNAFYQTPLLSFLQSQHIEHIVIMGCKTEFCIDTAVRTATINDFDVTLVQDGHSTTDSQVLTAEEIIAHHNHALHGHDNIEHFSLVRNSNEDIFVPTHNNYR
ncbi:isochorismatase family protein [Planococcus liqunii]|uniref:isochorismatase family protein n=1 Tax=Planococcus liqunii TaxID=3058394 RepID=UPI0026117AA2|nr:isochorismatase family protein [Planococcus sp. N056]WKA51963.1 isochorismatase family protein [Planococcus sp. N056]